MRLIFHFMLELFFTTMALASSDQELRQSINLAMKCEGKEPPKGPVMAVSASRFVQIVVILHERFQTPLCGQRLNKPMDINDERTWPFCVFGTCEEDKCRCAASFVGPKCTSFTQKCWLMYCFLTSCHPIHQSLHCLCDPRLYGTQVSTGIYWYDKGKSSKYSPPPKGWKDQPSAMIRITDNSAIQMGNNTQQTNRKHGGASSQALSGHGLKNGNFKAKSQNKPLTTPKENNRTGGPPKAERPGESSTQKVSNAGSGSSANAEAVQKTDVEEALKELEEVPSMAALMPNCLSFRTVLVFCSVDYIIYAVMLFL